MIKEMNGVFNAEGLVLGHLWGGGTGVYPSVKLTGFSNIDDLFKTVEEKLKNGSLDSGMGYEKLIGAALMIEEKRTIICEESPFCNSIFTPAFFGNLKENQIDFLERCLYS